MVAEKPTDIRVHAAEVAFEQATLDPPFVISGRPLGSLTVVRVQLTISDRSGRHGRARGAGILSVPWSWPHPHLDLDVRESVMRALVRTFGVQLASSAAGGSERWGDPFTLWRPLYERLDETVAEAALDTGVDEIPRLAGLLALGAVDNALHDGWSRLAGSVPYEMYTAGYLNRDLGWVMPELAGVYPGEALGPRREHLPVQHALGVGDPLTTNERAPHDRVRSLEQWNADEGIAHLKLKLSGDEAADAQRIVAAHALASSAPEPLTMSLDPNEAYEPESLGRMLDELVARKPEAAAAITYLEQPFPRSTTVAPDRMAQLTSRFPVLMDEGYSRFDQLRTMAADGWSGAVIKAAKGQSHAMITLAAARTLGLAVAIQDLTTVGPALEHSLGLAAELGADWPQVEYNSRQYAAGANAELQRSRPELVTVRDGRVRVGRLATGLYSG